METAIIIVNWNGKKYLKDCLSSLNDQAYKDFQVIFVDNGSKDDSVEFVKKEFPHTSIIELQENTGFAYANNVGIQRAFENEACKYIITLNNDTIADKYYVESLVKTVRENESVGSVQPKVLNYFDSTKIDSAGIVISRDGAAKDRGFGEKDCGQHDKERDIFGASASAALYTRTALEKTKIREEEYFDNDFFAYYEDVDLAWRLRLAGFSSVFAPDARVLHVHSATGQNYSAFKYFYVHRNRYYVLLKNLPFWFLLRALLLVPVRYLLSFCAACKKSGAAGGVCQKSKKTNIVEIIWKSWRDIFLNLPAMLRKRQSVQKLKVISGKEIAKWFDDFGINMKDTV